jgi:5-methyltetrahydropteroyltriglutamate--homocysteine methyltransferase
MPGALTFEQIRDLRVDQIGGLSAPAYLREARAGHEAGKVDAGGLRAAQDKAVAEIVARQDAIGFPVISDGELRRRNFQESFAAAVSGFDADDAASQRIHDAITKAPLARAEQDFAARGPAILTRRPVVARLKLVRNPPLEEFVAAQRLTSSPVKVTLLSPDRIAQRFDHENSKAVYSGLDEFVDDVVRIEREMIAALVKAGCRYIQIDAPGYTAYVDKVSLERMRSRGEDPAENLARSIKADNAVIAGFDDVVFGLHVCRGNPRVVDPRTGRIAAQWHREGFYDGIAEQLFGGLNHQRLLLEYDSERAGGFAPLRHVPRGRIAVLGLLTSKSDEVERPEDLARRIDEAAKHLPLDQLALSPQCGFGGMGAPFPAEAQWGKFEAMLKTAEMVWG